jgi:hypothetical protein
MADINREDIQIKASQRMDDTDVGGGQMTSTQIVSGAVNQIFDDISRLSRVYGNVSLKKIYLSITTSTRKPYFGGHAIMTENVKDPNVGVCFFSSEDWFDTRTAARNRMESYLVKGPIFQAYLWGPHYRGTRNLSFITDPAWPIPGIGEVLVLVKNDGLSNEVVEYVRITDISSELRTFIYLYSGNSSEYSKKVISVTIGKSLSNDYVGQEASINGWALSAMPTHIYTTVAADASRYFGVTTLAEDATADNLQIKVKDIMVPIVPSTQSESSITDYGVGSNVTMLLQTEPSGSTVTRSISYNITTNSKLFLGEAILPGSFSWSGGLTLTDDGANNIYNGSIVIGSIDYTTGTIVFGNPGVNLSGTGSVTYVPACAPTEISDTGGIQIEIGNRGFTYVYNCEPLPKKGTLKIDYLSGGKWYSIKDTGYGQILGTDPAMGSGSVNFITGSVSMTLGAMPDIGSKILLFWAKDAAHYDLSGETLPLKYEFTTANEGITRNTLKIRWGASGSQCIMDNGNGDLVVATGSGESWTPTATVVGYIKYATGLCNFGIGASQTVPLSSESFRITYSYGDKFQETFNPIRHPDGTVSFFLSNTPVKPGTFAIEWHTLQEEYDGTSGMRRHIDPTHKFQDDGLGFFKNDINDGTTNWIQGHINYTTGEVHCMPDRKGTFPITTYIWFNTGLFDENHVPLKEYKFHSIQYRPAASIWPTDGTLVCDYSCTDGANSADYQLSLDKKFFVKSTSNLEIIPGSLSFYAGIGTGTGTTYIVDPGNGKLFKDVIGTTGIGTQIGTINYADRIIRISDDTITARTLTIRNCLGTIAIDPVQIMMFRSPGTPIQPTSFGIKGTLSDGTVLTGASDFNGNIIGANVKGIIDYNNGICQVSFGAWEEDTYSALPPYVPGPLNPANQPEWYYGAPTDGNGNVWHPKSVRASTINMNCVITSYLPLDADLLGMDPVRLPLDGKVPIFRDGYIIAIHNTETEALPTIVVPGALPQISRTDVDLIEVYDSRPEVDGGSQYWPDGGNYTADKVNGVITILPTFDLSGFTQPMKALHRIEDVVLASDVQITGHISITQPLNRSYPKDTTQVSSVLPIGTLQSRAYNEFDQAVWSGVWSDTLIGNPVSLANYNFVDFPITVINKSCTKERWLILLKSPTTVDIIGENLGTQVSGISIASGSLGNYSPIDGLWLGDPGFTGGYIAVRNKNFANEPYWVMSIAGFGAGWALNNCLRFNTDAANYPIWMVRTTLQARETEDKDNYFMQFRGDSA